MKMEESVPKHRYIKFRGRGITQKKERNLYKLSRKSKLRFNRASQHEYLGIWSASRCGRLTLGTIGVCVSLRALLDLSEKRHDADRVENRI